MASNRYDLLTAREGRDGKTYFTKVGVAFANKSSDSFTLSFEALPIPNKEGEVRVLMMPPRDRDSTQASAPRQQRSLAQEMSDDPPF